MATGPDFFIDLLAFFLAAFFAGFMLSSIVWAFLLAAIVDRFLGGAGVRWARVTYRACAILFLTLALASLRDLLTRCHAESTRLQVLL